MNWEAIGAIGQAISALALVVVIVQVRLSTAETLRSIRQDRADDLRRTLASHAESEWLNRVVAKGLQAYGVGVPFHAELVQRGLTPEEASAFDAWTMSWWLSDAQYIAHIDKLTKGERASFDAMMRVQYTVGMRSKFLEINRQVLNPDAVRYIDNLLAQPE
jgi:hypothetical protein